MKLCITQGEMHAKTPDGLHCYFVPRPDEHSASCSTCAVGAVGPCRCGGQKCTPSSRIDHSWGIWIAEPVSS